LSKAALQRPAAPQALTAVLAAMAPAQLEALLGGAPAKAAPWVRAAAECGLPEAQVRLGRMLLEGRGVDHDPAAALAWFLKAAEAGDADACNMAGRCYENGWGAKADAAEAARWFAKAAGAGCAWAQYNLGHLHLDGLGVPREPAVALAWYRRAAAQGHVRAMNLVGRCLEQGWGAPADPDAAADWYRRSAEGGYFRGRYNHASALARQGRTAEAVAQFDAACAEAPPASRRTMALALSREPDPALSALGARWLKAA